MVTAPDYFRTEDGLHCRRIKRGQMVQWVTELASSGDRDRRLF
jgi:hypothetical protein